MQVSKARRALPYLPGLIAYGVLAAIGILLGNRR